MVEKISKLITEARLARDKFRATCLSSLKSILIENSKAKKPVKESAAVLMYLKKLEKSLAYYKDTISYALLEKEISIVKELTPKTLSEFVIAGIVEEYFSFAKDVKPGIAIKNLKEQHGDQNGTLIAKHVMAYLKR